MVTYDALFCLDCAVVIANGDTSGLYDEEKHLAHMEATLTGWAVVYDPADLGFYRAHCNGCGQDIATDRWFTGGIEKE